MKGNQPKDSLNEWYLKARVSGRFMLVPSRFPKLSCGCRAQDYPKGYGVRYNPDTNLWVHEKPKGCGGVVDFEGKEVFMGETAKNDSGFNLSEWFRGIKAEGLHRADVPRECCRLSCGCTRQLTDPLFHVAMDRSGAWYHHDQCAAPMDVSVDVSRDVPAPVRLPKLSSSRSSTPMIM